MVGACCHVRWTWFNVTKMKGKRKVPLMWDGYETKRLQLCAVFEENYPFFADRSICLSSMSRIGTCCFSSSIKWDLLVTEPQLGFCSFYRQPQIWQLPSNTYLMMTGVYRLFTENFSCTNPGACDGVKGFMYNVVFLASGSTCLFTPGA